MLTLQVNLYKFHSSYIKDDVGQPILTKRPKNKEGAKKKNEKDNQSKAEEERKRQEENNRFLFLI